MRGEHYSCSWGDVGLALEDRRLQLGLQAAGKWKTPYMIQESPNPQLSFGKCVSSFAGQRASVTLASSWKMESPLHDTRVPKPFSCPWGWVALALGDRGLQLCLQAAGKWKAPPWYKNPCPYERHWAKKNQQQGSLYTCLHSNWEKNSFPRESLASTHLLRYLSFACKAGVAQTSQEPSIEGDWWCDSVIGCSPGMP